MALPGLYTFIISHLILFLGHWWYTEAFWGFNVNLRIGDFKMTEKGGLLYSFRVLNTSCIAFAFRNQWGCAIMKMHYKLDIDRTLHYFSAPSREIYPTIAGRREESRGHIYYILLYYVYMRVPRWRTNPKANRYWKGVPPSFYMASYWRPIQLMNFEVSWANDSLQWNREE